MRLTAADANALITEVGAGILGARVVSAVVVFQAEASLMSFGHSLALAVDYVEVGEHFHTVVVAMTGVPVPDVLRQEWTEVGGPDVRDASCETQKSSRLELPTFE